MIVYIKSFTAARKALALLSKHGIRGIVERSFKKGGGCGFALKITDKNADKAEVCALLGSIGVSCGLSR